MAELLQTNLAVRQVHPHPSKHRLGRKFLTPSAVSPKYSPRVGRDSRFALSTCKTCVSSSSQDVDLVPVGGVPLIRTRSSGRIRREVGSSRETPTSAHRFGGCQLYWPSLSK